MAFLRRQNRHTWICLQLVTLFRCEEEDAEIISDTGCILQEALKPVLIQNLYYKVLNCYSPHPHRPPAPRRPPPTLCN